MLVEARHAGLLLVMQACGLAVLPTYGRRNKWARHVVNARDLTLLQIPACGASKPSTAATQLARWRCPRCLSKNKRFSKDSVGLLRAPARSDCTIPTCIPSSWRACTRAVSGMKHYQCHPWVSRDLCTLDVNVLTTLAFAQVPGDLQSLSAERDPIPAAASASERSNPIL